MLSGYLPTIFSRSGKKAAKSRLDVSVKVEEGVCSKPEISPSYQAPRVAEENNQLQSTLLAPRPLAISTQLSVTTPYLERSSGDQGGFQPPPSGGPGNAWQLKPPKPASSIQARTRGREYPDEFEGQLLIQSMPKVATTPNPYLVTPSMTFNKEQHYRHARTVELLELRRSRESLQAAKECAKLQKEIDRQATLIAAQQRQIEVQLELIKTATVKEKFYRERDKAVEAQKKQIAEMIEQLDMQAQIDDSQNAAIASLSKKVERLEREKRKMSQAETTFSPRKRRRKSKEKQLQMESGAFQMNVPNSYGTPQNAPKIVKRKGPGWWPF